MSSLAAGSDSSWWIQIWRQSILVRISFSSLSPQRHSADEPFARYQVGETKPSGYKAVSFGWGRESSIKRYDLMPWPQIHCCTPETQKSSPATLYLLTLFITIKSSNSGVCLWWRGTRECVLALVLVWASEDSFWELVFFLYLYVGSKD